MKLLTFLIPLSLVLTQTAFAVTGSGSIGGAETRRPESSLANSAWFHKPGPMTACIEVSNDFGFTPGDLAGVVEKSFQSWQDYIQKKFITAHKNDLETLLHTLTIRPECSGNEDLKFVFGDKPVGFEHQTQELNEPISFAVRTHFSPQQKESKGLIWVAKTGGVKIEKTECFDATFENLPYPYWSDTNALQAIVTHELGHAFGVPHIEGTIMSVDISRWFRSRCKADINAHAFEGGHSDRHDARLPKNIFDIDQQNEVFSCSFSAIIDPLNTKGVCPVKSYRGVITVSPPWWDFKDTVEYKTFKFFTGHEPRSRFIQATLNLGQEIGIELSDGTQAFTFKSKPLKYENIRNAEFGVATFKNIQFANSPFAHVAEQHRINAVEIISAVTLHDGSPVTISVNYKDGIAAGWLNDEGYKPLFFSCNYCFMPNGTIGIAPISLPSFLNTDREDDLIQEFEKSKKP